MQAIRIDYACGHCTGGNMVATSFQCYLDGIQHQCDKCRAVTVLKRRYPYVDYVNPAEGDYANLPARNPERSK